MKNDYRSHISVAVWAALLALALSALITLPPRVFTTSLLGSPVSLAFDAALVAGMVGVAVVCIGLEAAIRTHPNKAVLRYTYRFWGLPAVIVLVASLLLQAAPVEGLWAAALGGVGVALAAALAAEYHTVDPADPAYRGARWLLNLLVYATALAAFILIYNTRSRSLISASLIGGIAGLLALDILRGVQREQGITLLYAAIITLILAQATWVLNYWPFTAPRAGVLLLIGFYLLVGLAQHELAGRLSARRALEYVAASAGVVALLFWLRV
ncbi:MAG: hypothetical protein HUU23_14745 [Caldilineales bacterium]|nr:hypothetical protein [Caldilineales bacterium]